MPRPQEGTPPDTRAQCLPLLSAAHFKDNHFQLETHFGFLRPDVTVKMLRKRKPPPTRDVRRIISKTPLQQREQNTIVSIVPRFIDKNQITFSFSLSNISH